MATRRYRIPDHWRDYKVTARGEGKTYQEAEFYLNEQIDYHKRWIKGTCIEEKKWGDGRDSLGDNFVRKCDLLFRQRSYVRNRSRG